MKMESKDNQRTLQQNKSLHKYCQQVATELNNAGVSMEVFIKNIEADHTMESVKSLWRAFAKAKYGKTSTKELTKAQIDQVYDEVNRHLAQLGIHINFPSNNNQINVKYITLRQRIRNKWSNEFLFIKAEKGRNQYTNFPNKEYQNEKSSKNYLQSRQKYSLSFNPKRNIILK